MAVRQIRDKGLDSASAAKTPEGNGFVCEFLHSAAYSAFQQPVSAVAQIVDHTVGSHLAQKTEYMSRHESLFGIATWHAQTLGAALGGLVPLFVVSGLVKSKLMPAAVMGKAGLLSERAAIGLSIKESAATGLITDSLLKPCDGGDNHFWNQRLLNGVGGAAMFTTMTATSLGLACLSKTAAVRASGLSSLLSNSVASGMLSGMPAGAISAEYETVMHYGRSATVPELARSIYSTSLVGAAFGIKHQLWEHPVTNCSSVKSNLANNGNTVKLNEMSAPKVSDQSFDQLNGNTTGDGNLKCLVTGRGTDAAVLSEKEGTCTQTPARAGLSVDTLAKLGKAFRDWDVSRLEAFVAAGPPSRVALIDSLLASNSTSSQFDCFYLPKLEQLQSYFPEGSQTFQKAVNLKLHDSCLSRLNQFVQTDPAGRLPLLERLLDDPYTAKKVSPFCFDCLDTLSGALSQKAMQSLVSGKLSKVNLLDVSTFVAAQPASRSALIETIADAQGAAERLSNHIKLRLFPDEVASRLIDSANAGGASIPSLLGKLRNLKEGPYLADLVSEHIQRNTNLSDADVQRLTQEARSRAESVPPAGVQSLIDRPDDSRMTLPERHIKRIATEILKEIPPERTIVLLGRGTKPLVPLLRSEGRDVVYFLWSRLQIGEAQTEQFWLNEVPPKSFVIDTGYVGQILDRIGVIDPTIDPMVDARLLKSEGRYKALLDWNDRNIVHSLGDFPDIPGRSVGYTRAGTAISKQVKRDEPFTPAREVTALTENLLTHSGLPSWWAWRYGTFVGLTAKERLGLGSDEEVQLHYARVRDERDAWRAKFVAQRSDG